MPIRSGKHAARCGRLSSTKAVSIIHISYQIASTKDFHNGIQGYDGCLFLNLGSWGTRASEHFLDIVLRNPIIWFVRLLEKLMIQRL